MKRLFLFLCLLLCGMGGAYGQTLIAEPNMIPPGYGGSLTFSGAGINFTSSTRGFYLKLTHSTSGQQYEFGTTPFGPYWFYPGPGPLYPPLDSISNGVTIPWNAPTGTYDVQLIGYNYYYQAYTITGNNLINVTPTLNYAHFQGRMIRDGNANCVQDGPDVGVGGHLVKITPGPYYAVTDNNGAFDAILPVGTYTFSGPPLPYGSLVCPTGGSQVATMHTAYDTVSGINFYYTPGPNTDLQSQLFVNPHRPGFNVNVTNQVKNLSFQDATNVTAMLVKPSFMAFDSFHVAPVSVSGDTARFVLPVLPLYAQQNFTVRLAVPIVQIGTPFHYSGMCNSTTPDLSLLNNSSYFSDLVRGSYDPNDKRVWNAGGENADEFIEVDDTLLRYMIRFQNTGNDTAFNIWVRDTLDADLDPGSLEVIGASHNFQLMMNDSSGRPLEFYFPNILLVDSFRNEPMSHGFIEYTIQRRNGLPLGASIDNTASIYFDFNAPIVTNTVHSVICPKMNGAFTATATHLDASFGASTDGLANSWVWDFGDGSTGSGAQVTHTYGASGTYTVTLIQGNSCGRVDTLVSTLTVVLVGTAEPAVTHFEVYPNPTDGLVMVHVKGARAGAVDFVLYDGTGRVVEAWTGSMGGNGYRRSIQLPAQTKGLYYLRAQGKTWTKTATILVH